MNKDLLFSLFIFKPDFIEAFSSNGAVRFDGALRFLLGEIVRWHVVGIVNTACDNGLIRITFKKIDNDFLTDPWSKDDPIIAARKRLATRIQQELFSS